MVSSSIENVKKVFCLYACHVHMIHVSCTCYVHMIHMSCTCSVQMIHMSCTCNVYVMHMSCTCFVKVVYRLWWVDIRLTFTFSTGMLTLSWYSCLEVVIDVSCSVLKSKCKWYTCLFSDRVSSVHFLNINCACFV